MELVDGPSLDELIRSTGPLPLPTADAIARGVLAGVAMAHSRGLVHRDLKPANVLLATGPEGVIPKVGDFGLARLLDDGSGRTRTGTTMGTPQYMAPEQVRDAKSVGPESDVFALGAILYEMVTGRRAFDGEDIITIFQATASASYTPPERLRADLPDRMRQAIAGALRPDRGQRIQTADALLALWVGDATVLPVADSETVRRVVALAAARSIAPPTSSDTWSEAPQRQSPVKRVASSSSLAVVWLGVGGGVVAVAAAAVALALGLGLLWWWNQPLPPDFVATADPAAVIPDAEPHALEPILAPSVPAEPSLNSAPPRVQPTTALPALPLPVEPDVPTQPPGVTEHNVEAQAPTPSEPVPPAPEPSPTHPETDIRSGLPPALRSRSETVRMSHLLLLAADPSSAATLDAVARTDPSPEVRARAFRTAMEHWRRGLGPADIHEATASWTVRNGSKRMRTEALTAIGRKGTRIHDAATLLTDIDPELRTAAISAVRDVGIRTDTSGARAALTARVVAETDPTVAEFLRSAIAAL